MSNKERLGTALAICRDGLAPFVVGSIKRAQCGKFNDEQIWARCILPEVMVSRNKPQRGTLDEMSRSLDLSDCLKLMLFKNWRIIADALPVRSQADIFHSKLELIRNYRNTLAHPDGQAPADISSQDMEVVLNTIESVLVTIGSTLAGKIAEIKRELQQPIVTNQIQSVKSPGRKKRTNSVCVLNTQSVYDALQKIPKGRVLSYSDVDDLITGRGTGAQAVSEILRRNSDWPLCHRVVRIKGYLSPGFSRGGAEGQRKELEAEGVRFDALGRVRPEYFWEWTKDS